MTGDIRFIVSVPDEDGPPRPVRGRISGEGATVSITFDQPPALSRVGNVPLLAVLGERLADQDLQVSVADPYGVLATLGAVRPSLLGRLLLRSPHVRLGPVRNLGRSFWRGRAGVPLRDLLPVGISLDALPVQLGRTRPRRPRWRWPGRASSGR